MTPIRTILFILTFIAVFGLSTVFAQTSAFNYQGKLTDGVAPASGTYQMTFSLFDAASGGSQVGSTITNNSVSVASGVFAVTLDFGTSPFSAGADRWLEVSVKKPAEGSFTLLTPRQQMTSSPYALRTLSATSADNLSAACVGCVTSARIADGTLVDADVSPVAGIAYSKLNLVNSVQNSDLVANSVTTSKVANGTITTSKLADDSVTSIKIVDGSVASADILDGTITNADISPTAAIATSKISGLGSLATVTPSGTANATTFLRGDNTWATPASGGGSLPVFAARSTNVVVGAGGFVDVITIALEANKIYFFDGAIVAQRVGATSGTGNMRLTYTGSATTDIGIEANGAILLGTTFNSTSFDYEIGTASTNSIGATVIKEFTVNGYIRTTTAGTLALQFARGASNTTVDLNAREGTYLRATPLN